MIGAVAAAPAARLGAMLPHANDGIALRNMAHPEAITSLWRAPGYTMADFASRWWEQREIALAEVLNGDNLLSEASLEEVEFEIVAARQGLLHARL